MIVAGDAEIPEKVIEFPLTEVRRLTGLDVPLTEARRVLQHPVSLLPAIRN